MKRLAVRIAIYAILFYTLAGITLCEMTVRLPRLPLGPAVVQEAQAAARDADADLQTVEIHSADGLVLRGWFFRNHQPGTRTVILLHGQADNRGGMLGHAKLFLRYHYDVLAPDSRAHGESGGKIATYGAYEADDVHRWLDWLGQNRESGCVYGLGESMGAAILLQSLMGEARFCAVVAESSFASLREIGYDRVGELLHAGTWPGRTFFRPQIELAFLYGRVHYGADLADVSPIRAVSTSKVPVLLIHGTADDTISPRHSEMLSRSRSPKIDLWEPVRVGHTEALSSAPDEFERRVIGFFASHPSH